jgi:hypothetical protein
VAGAAHDRHADQRVEPRQPNPKRVPIIPTARATPDLTKVEEVGFSDLSEGGWIPATSRVQSWEVWGKPSHDEMTAAATRVASSLDQHAGRVTRVGTRSRVDP